MAILAIRRMVLVVLLSSVQAFSFAPPTALRRVDSQLASTSAALRPCPLSFCSGVRREAALRQAPLRVCAMAGGEVVDNVAVVLLAGGVGSRMKAGKPKQFLEIEGKTILRTSLEVFLGVKGVTSISIVLAEEYRDQLADVAAADSRACHIPCPSGTFLNSPRSYFCCCSAGFSSTA